MRWLVATMLIIVACPTAAWAQHHCYPNCPPPPKKRHHHEHHPRAPLIQAIPVLQLGLRLEDEDEERAREEKERQEKERAEKERQERAQEQQEKADETAKTCKEILDRLEKLEVRFLKMLGITEEIESRLRDVENRVKADPPRSTSLPPSPARDT